jgi:hypothetical protein
MTVFVAEDHPSRDEDCLSWIQDSRHTLAKPGPLSEGSADLGSGPGSPQVQSRVAPYDAEVGSEEG